LFLSSSKDEKTHDGGDALVWIISAVYTDVPVVLGLDLFVEMKGQTRERRELEVGEVEAHLLLCRSLPSQRHQRLTIRSRRFAPPLLRNLAVVALGVGRLSLHGCCSTEQKVEPRRREKGTRAVDGGGSRER